MVDLRNGGRQGVKSNNGEAGYRATDDVCVPSIDGRTTYGSQKPPYSISEEGTGRSKLVDTEGCILRILLHVSYDVDR